MAEDFSNQPSLYKFGFVAEKILGEYKRVHAFCRTVQNACDQTDRQEDCQRNEDQVLLP